MSVVLADFVLGECHEWREITRGMVTRKQAKETGYVCIECRAFVKEASQMRLAPKCRTRWIHKSWLPKLAESAS